MDQYNKFKKLCSLLFIIIFNSYNYDVNMFFIIHISFFGRGWIWWFELHSYLGGVVILKEFIPPLLNKSRFRPTTHVSRETSNTFYSSVSVLHSSLATSQIIRKKRKHEHTQTHNYRIGI